MVKEDKEVVEELCCLGIPSTDSSGSEKPQSRGMHLVGHSSLHSSQCLDGDRLHLCAIGGAQPPVREFRLAASYFKVSHDGLRHVPKAKEKAQNSNLLGLCAQRRDR